MPPIIVHSQAKAVCHLCTKLNIYMYLTKVASIGHNIELSLNKFQHSDKKWIDVDHMYSWPVVLASKCLSVVGSYKFGSRFKDFLHAKKAGRLVVKDCVTVVRSQAGKKQWCCGLEKPLS